MSEEACKGDEAGAECVFSHCVMTREFSPVYECTQQCMDGNKYGRICPPVRLPIQQHVCIAINCIQIIGLQSHRWEKFGFWMNAC